jgi:endonuclease YncB( thermonuclease family)
MQMVVEVSCPEPRQWRQLLAAIAVAVLGSPPIIANASPRTIVVPQGQRFVCTPTAVWDGDGPIWCAEGPHLRLNGIVARELDGSCREGHPCPKASGLEARGALVGLLGGARGQLLTGHVRVAGPRLACRSFGSAKGNRTGALCRLPDGRDLSCALVRGGTALPWARYGGDRLCR